MPADLIAQRVRTRLQRIAGKLRRALAAHRDKRLIRWLTREESLARSEDGGPWKINGTDLPPWEGTTIIGWADPTSQPRPDTVAEGLDYVTAHLDEMAAQLAAEIEVCAAAVVDPSLLPAVLARPDLPDRWPFARPGGDNRIGWYVLHALTRAASPDECAAAGIKPPEDLGDPVLPGTLTPLEVARWARDALNRAAPSPLALGDHVVRDAEAGRFPHGIGFNDLHFPAGSLALLYRAETAVRTVTPRPLTMPPVDVTQHTVRTLTTIGGAKQCLVARDPRAVCAQIKASPRPDEPARLVIYFADARSDRRLQLSLPYDEAGPLTAIAARYDDGPAIVRDVLAIYAFQWARFSQPPGPFWWWPNEHLRMIGLPPTAENRSRLLARMDRAHAVLIEAFYGQGDPIVGPMIANLASVRPEHKGSGKGGRRALDRARKIAIHDALYTGIRAPDGEPGNWWWLIPTELLRAPADGTTGRVHLLAVYLGSMFRTQLKDGRVGPVKVTARHLANVLGYSGRQDGRLRDDRMKRGLETTLEEGRRLGIGTPTVVRGTLDRDNALVEFELGNRVQECIERRQRPLAAFVPATGDEFERWLSDSGLTTRQTATLLDVSTRLVQLAARYGLRPLPWPVRNGLRSYLWKETTTD